MSIESQSGLALVNDWYAEYGAYVNSHRALPGLDGLKSVHRRLFWAMNRFQKGKFLKSATLVGETIGRYHPHGDMSTYGALCTLVTQGVMDGQGNWGANLMESLPPAAARYTEVMMSPEQARQLFELVDYCPSSESEMGFQEPDYLIVPVPIALTTGTRGIGIGTACNIPSFSRASLIKALKMDDPKQLDASFKGIHVVDEDLQGLWDHGKGHLTYSYSVYTEHSKIDGQEVIVIEGAGDLFKPRLGIFSEWIDAGYMWMRDESSDVIRIVLGKSKNIRRISIDDIRQKAESVTRRRVGYNIQIWDHVAGKVRRIGIKEWLFRCYEQYVETFNLYVDDNIAHRRSEIALMRKIPGVTNDLGKLRNKLSDEEICKNHEIDASQLKRIDDFPMRYHRPAVVNQRINVLENQIKEYESRRI